jgi:outer membrane lipoprotein LolB
MSLPKKNRFLILAVILLSGCNTLKEYVQRESTLVEEEFYLQGRLAVTIEGEGSSAKILWRHFPDRDSIRVLTPVGTTLATILVSRSAGAVLETKDESFQAGNAEDLTEKVLGWRFPLDGMQHWVKGKLQPGEPIRRISPKDRLGRLTYFEQNGWKVTYDAYKDDTLLPRKMSLEFEKMKLKFVVDKWKQI